jgi:hypothetical protein
MSSMQFLFELDIAVSLLAVGGVHRDALVAAHELLPLVQPDLGPPLLR